MIFVKNFFAPAANRTVLNSNTDYTFKGRGQAVPSEFINTLRLAELRFHTLLLNRSQAPPTQRQDSTKCLNCQAERIIPQQGGIDQYFSHVH